ncbi:hypothetical protein JCM19314_941 [Nonlabens ulvanivorans]|uniref:Uncharacterized protein n=1 Tax=Nonlabens ulvanivorans TaxID=906888 RepID=A0A090QWC8_NONUL|nr:hypothetical protein [Nonlabens ulvanivorans]GAK99756.1 hypothetical protein JCM19314_941 [Nonlabens ulvanivorans]
MKYILLFIAILISSYSFSQENIQELIKEQERLEDLARSAYYEKDGKLLFYDIFNQSDRWGFRENMTADELRAYIKDLDQVKAKWEAPNGPLELALSRVDNFHAYNDKLCTTYGAVKTANSDHTTDWCKIRDDYKRKYPRKSAAYENAMGYWQRFYDYANQLLEKKGSNSSGNSSSDSSTSNRQSNQFSSSQTSSNSNTYSGNQQIEDSSTNTLRTPEQINADYTKFQETNLKAESQMGSGNFLGAAETYASAGRETEMYGAIGGHVVTQFASLLSENRQAKVEDKENSVEKDLRLYDELSDELKVLYSNQEYEDFIQKEWVLKDIENKILRDANWLGNKYNPDYFKLTDELRKKQFLRTKLALEINTKIVLSKLKDEDFVTFLMNLHQTELRYQSYNSVKSKVHKSEEYAKNLWTLINNTQINRVKYILDLNKREEILHNASYSEMIIYLTNNYEDEEFEDRVLTTFNKLDDVATRTDVAKSILFNNTQSDYAYYLRYSEINERDLFWHHRKQYDKLLLLLDEGKGLNYYASTMYRGDSIPFYKLLKKRSGTIALSLGPAVYAKYDIEKIVYKKVLSFIKADKKESGLKEKQLVNERKDCLTPNCE